MRSERRGPGCAAALLAGLLALGCSDPPDAPAPIPQRFAGVRKGAAPTAAQSPFCDRSYPAGGEGGRRYAPAPRRPLPGDGEPSGAALAAGRGWTWVNLWATWCTPCVEEMALLRRWRDGFARDGVEVELELVSIDGADREKELAAWRPRLPGRLGWLRSEADLEPLLLGLGVERDAMIPVHALVDPAGWLRCVRVGAVHEQDYAAVKALLAR